MTYYDVFNGDADGLCALLQLRLTAPRDAVLVSGVKRDIRLLDRVDAQQGDEIVVLDISLDANRSALERVLQRGAKVFWFDHHHPGDPLQHPALDAHIDTDPQVCSSLIVDRYLDGKFRDWAIVAAFGDNLEKTARRLAAAAGLSESQTQALRDLGICLNYNAYGETIDDLLFSPVELFEDMKRYDSPHQFMQASQVPDALRQRMRDDLEHALAIATQPLASGSAYAVLPDAGWARRVLGVYANHLAQHDPRTAHAVMVEKRGGYMVSIRAPAAYPRGAASIARAFHSGGGREGAAGIDFLPSAELPHFLDVLRRTYESNT